MKFPKNRSDLYVVVRGEGEAICGAFSNYEAAEDYRGACEQEWLEKTSVPVPYYVRLTTYYG